MSDTVVAPSPTLRDPAIQPVAPVWHTAIVLAVLLGMSALGALSHGYGLAGVRSQVAQVRSWYYLRAAIVEWVVVAFVWYGVRRHGVRFGTLLGNRWTNVRSVFRDLGIAVVFLMGSNVILGTLSVLLGAKSNPALRNLMPQTHMEIPFYLLLSLSAGICEEIVFRGYLQTQFRAWTHSSFVALLVQGAIFGAAHGYQGIKHMIVIVVFGWLFGLLALWRRSLISGMMAHALQDGVLGLVVRHSLK